MNEQKFLREESVGSDLMSAWLASGGACDMQVDAYATPSRQRGAGSDDGLAAGTPTTGGPECPGAWVNEGLQAHRYTTYGDCVDDRLVAHRYTTYGDCVDDELQAGGPTRYVFACVPIDDGLRATGPKNCGF